MAAETVLVILRMASELSSPGAVALADAARDALGADTQVRVEASSEPPREVIQRIGPRAIGIVWINWDGRQHRTARLRFYLPEHQRWVEDERQFQPDDPEWERGRTLGYLIASVVVEGEIPGAAEPGGTAPTPFSAEDAGSAADAVRHDRNGDPLPRVHLAAAASAAGPGNGRGLGAWLGAEYAIGARFALGAFTEVRFGNPTVPEADVRSRVLGAGVLGTWYAYRPSPFWLGLRGGAGLVQVAVQRSSLTGTGTSERARIGAEGELALQLGYMPSSFVGIYLELGGQLMGRTELVVADVREATLPLVTPVVRLGMRIGF